MKGSLISFKRRMVSFLFNSIAFIQITELHIDVNNNKDTILGDFRTVTALNNSKYHTNVQGGFFFSNKVSVNK